MFLIAGKHCLLLHIGTHSSCGNARRERTPTYNRYECIYVIEADSSQDDPVCLVCLPACLRVCVPVFLYVCTSVLLWHTAARQRILRTALVL